MIDSEQEQRIFSFITPDGIKLYVEADHCLADKYTTQLVDSLRSDFSKPKYKIQKEFGFVEEYR